jgi:hypothetical protein
MQENLVSLPRVSLKPSVIAFESRKSSPKPEHQFPSKSILVLTTTMAAAKQDEARIIFEVAFGPDRGISQPTDIHIALVRSVALAFQHCIKIILVSKRGNLEEEKLLLFVCDCSQPAKIPSRRRSWSALD